MHIICWVGTILFLVIVCYDFITVKEWINNFITIERWINNPRSSLPLIIVSLSLIILGNLYVIAQIAHKTGKKQVSIRYIKKRVFTFYSTVFSKNFIEVAIGFVGQVILSFIYWHAPGDFFIYFLIYTLVFFGFCATPIIGELNNLERTYIKAFNDKLERRLQRMKKHYIIIGYGRFGKTVINDLFENYVYNEPRFESIYSEGRLWFKCFGYKSLSFLKRISERKLKEADEGEKPVLLLERMLNERHEDVLFCTNLVIVDKDERLFGNVFSHPNLGKIGVVILDGLNCLRYDKENYKKKVYIPAIVGDAKNYSTLALARPDESKMVISLVPNEEAIFNIFTTIVNKQKERKGIITVPATSQERLLIPQSHATNISFLHGYRIRGWELGGIVAGNLLNKSDYKNVKFLILGCGRQLHFLLEKIWLEIIWKKEEISKDFLKDNCLIIGNDEYINSSVIAINGCTYWNHELAYVTNRAVYNSEDYRMLIPYLRGISYEPTLLGPIISGNVNKEKEPFNHINPEFFKGRPEIIIISSDYHEETIKVFNELNSISKKYLLEPKPVVIAESDPIVQEVVMELNKSQTEGNKSTKRPIPFLNEPYPIEYSENIVNCFDDGNKMVRGYMEAMTKQSGVILRACVEDKPGVFVKLCFLLAHLQVRNTTISKNILIPSFHNTHALPQREDYFCFFSDADLIEAEDKIEVKPNTDHIREIFVSSNDRENKKWLINNDESLIPKAEVPSQQSVCDSGSCMGLTFCPISSFERSVEGESNLLVRRDKIMARCTGNVNNSSCIPKNNRYEKYAKVYACCKGGNESGAIARLLYKFMLGDESQISYNLDRPSPRVLNLKYVMNVECYNPGFEFLEMYGNLEEPPKPNSRPCLNAECLQGIVISPVRFGGDWWEYSQKLKNKLGNPLFYFDGKEKNPDNILIITKDYRDILLKEYIQFQIEKTVEELSIEGVIKSESSTEEWKFKLYNKFKSKKIRKEVNIKAFTIDTPATHGTTSTPAILSETISKYVKKQMEEKEFGMFINMYFEDFGSSKDQQSCVCPIPDCPFKSKALYLLVKGEQLL